MGVYREGYLSWGTWKTLQNTITSNTVYYIEEENRLIPFVVDLNTPDIDTVWRAELMRDATVTDLTNVTDFVSNFQNSAIAVYSIDEGVAKAIIDADTPA